MSRTEYLPGELAQWDLWFPPVDVPLGAEQVGRPPVIVGVSGYSRWIAARMIPSRQVHDVLGGHLACLIELGGVPRKGVYDNEPAIARRRDGRAVLTDAFQRFRGVLGMGAVICRPGDPEAKGLVERANGYLETSFLPGRTFREVEDFNAQLGDWLTLANARVHRTLRCRPVDRIGEDRSAMLALPPLLPETAWRFSMRLGRDHHVRVATCDYSVHPRAIGHRVEVRVDLDTVTAALAGAEVACHRRSYAKHRTVTAAEHAAAGVTMRAQRHAPRPVDVDVQQRDLADYDRALGVA